MPDNLGEQKVGKELPDEKISVGLDKTAETDNSVKDGNGEEHKLPPDISKQILQLTGNYIGGLGGLRETPVPAYSNAEGYEEGRQDQSNSGDEPEPDVTDVVGQEVKKNGRGSQEEKRWFPGLLRKILMGGAIAASSLGYSESASAQSKEYPPKSSKFEPEKMNIKDAEAKLLKTLIRSFKSEIDIYKDGFEDRIKEVTDRYYQKQRNDKEKAAFEKLIDRQREAFLREAELAEANFNLFVQYAEKENNQFHRQAARLQLQRNLQYIQGLNRRGIYRSY